MNTQYNTETIAHLQGGIDALLCVETFIVMGNDAVSLDDVHELIVQAIGGLEAKQSHYLDQFQGAHHD